jgi:hypothetical protein
MPGTGEAFVALMRIINGGVFVVAHLLICSISQLASQNWCDK